MITNKDIKKPQWRHRHMSWWCSRWQQIFSISGNTEMSVRWSAFLSGRQIHCSQNSYNNLFSFAHLHFLQITKKETLACARLDFYPHSDSSQTSVILLKAKFLVFITLFIRFILFTGFVLSWLLILWILVIVLIVIHFFGFLSFYFDWIQTKIINLTSFFFAFELHSDTNLQKNKSFYLIKI